MDFEVTKSIFCTNTKILVYHFENIFVRRCFVGRRIFWQWLDSGVIFGVNVGRSDDNVTTISDVTRNGDATRMDGRFEGRRGRRMNQVGWWGSRWSQRQGRQACAVSDDFFLCVFVDRRVERLDGTWRGMRRWRRWGRTCRCRSLH